MSTARVLRDLDASFESFLDHALVEAEETELTPDKRRERRRRCDDDPLEFCKTYFPGIFDQPWNDLHEDLAELGWEDGFQYVSGHRRCGKSAFVFIGFGARRICLGRTLGSGIVTVALRDDDTAKQRTAALSRLIQRNRLLCYDYDVEVEQDLKGWHIINGVHLVAASYRMGLRSILDDEFNRIVLFLGDDLYNRQSVDSERDNEKVVNFIESEVRGQMEPDALAFVLGNSITTDCPISVLKERYPSRAHSLPALDENGESTWPEVFPTEYWIRFRDGDGKDERGVPLDVWAGDYMDEPLVIGEVFDADWIKTVNVNLIQILASLTACDPSHGTSPLACLKGLATVGYTDSSETVLLDVYGRTDSFLDLFDYVAALRDRFRAHWKVLAYENDFEQWRHAEPWYRMWCEQTRDALPVIVHYSKQLRSEYYGSSKESRILSLVHPYKTGRHRHADGLGGNDYDLHRAQLVAFGKAKVKLDILDAEATAVLLVPGYVGGGRRIEAVAPAQERMFGRPSWTGWR